ncbi:MAG: hypothetical protein ACUVV0_00495 [Anaerolineae bacterium]
MNRATIYQIEVLISKLNLEEKLALLNLLVESLRRELQPPPRPLSAYYGLGAGRGFKTVEEVDAFIRAEREAWERDNLPE